MDFVQKLLDFVWFCWKLDHVEKDLRIC